MASAVAPGATNLAQLSSELGGVPLRGDAQANGTILVSTASVTQQALEAAIAAHVPNPDFGVEIQTIRLRNVVPTLRSWANDARTVGNQGANVSQAQLKTMFTRLGTFMDRTADLLVSMQRDTE
jgi:hypothetical protein